MTVTWNFGCYSCRNLQWIFVRNLYYVLIADPFVHIVSITIDIEVILHVGIRIREGHIVVRWLER